VKPFIALVALVFALAACGGTGTQAAKSSAPTVASSSAASSSAAPAAAATTAPSSSAPTTAPAAKPPATASPANSGPAATAPPAATLSGPLVLITPYVTPSAKDYGVIEPTEIDMAAAHGIFQNIHWTAWNSKAAWGWGDFVSTNCNPDCAHGQAIKIRVVIAFGFPSGNRYTWMNWSSGPAPTQTHTFKGAALNLTGSLGGKRVPLPGAAPAPPATTAPPAPTTCAPVQVSDYRDPAQLAAVVARSICSMFGPPLPATVCKLVSGLKFSCTAALRHPWTGDVFVTADGKEFNIPSPPTSP
jgi:hypothetical protein